MTTALLFIVILAVLVFVHELGHFAVAKFFGIKVDRFALGFPPKLWGKKIGETEYQLNLIPFGGYVSIVGENGEPTPEVTDESSVQSQALDESRSFAKKNRAIQAAVLIAGITMNVLFAWVLLTAGYLVGSPSSVDGTNYPERIRDAKLLVSMVRPESPAAQAGLKAGDEIRSIGEASEIIQSPDAKQVSDFIAPRIGKNINFSVVRGVEPLTVSVSPIAGIIPDAGAIGIGMDTIGTLRLPIHLAILEGTRFTWNMTKLVFTGTLGFLKDAILGKADLAAVSGPIGIAGLVGEARGMGWSYVVTFTAFISVNLAVLNVLPLPALDGGRLLFVALEAIFRRRIPAKVAGITNAVGFALLIALMVFVTYRDIVKLI